MYSSKYLKCKRERMGHYDLISNYMVVSDGDGKAQKKSQIIFLSTIFGYKINILQFYFYFIFIKNILFINKFT